MTSKLKLSVLTLAFLLFGFKTFIGAKTFKIPEPLKRDIHANEQLFQQNPNSQSTRFELAMSYAYSGKIEDAWNTLKKLDRGYAADVIQKYKPLTISEPDQWKHHFKLAFGYYFNGQKDHARKGFDTVLKLHPNHVWSMGFIGLLEGEKGHPDATIEICKKALEIEPNATAIHFLLAEAYKKKGDYMSAMGHAMIVGRLKTEERIKDKRRRR